MSGNTHWEKEEFEDMVSRGIVALYETKIKKHKHSHKVFRLTPEHVNNIRKIGCYFTPEDRVIIGNLNEQGIATETQQLDIINEGRPDRAIWCDTKFDNTEGMMRDGSYIEINYLERVPKLPHPIKTKHEGRAYRIISVWGRNDCIEGHVHHIVISSDGHINDTYWTRPNYDPVTKRCPIEIVNAKNCQSQEESQRAESTSTVLASTIVQYYQDRRFLWNVTANEGIAKATFGVYPEEVKSLFYSRELPMTETGRKRPMLHWVAAHNRRMKSGIDIDIEKYLRGINEFVYKGTKFTITRPIKQTDKLRTDG